ncbi:SDR family oxidoreductase [Streptomyces phaeoluteigriseus]|uniref:SDR family oxidoreductase n=1 Tax=Streptomyces phaeoluteigriseus TaxID=114686 RepID=UPI0036CD9B5E
MSATLRTQVLVVGAGPAGLMLAGELRLGGAEVVVVERLETPTTESRASTLHARTMETLDARGLLDGFGTPPNEPMGHFGGIPLDLTLPGTHPGQWKILQAEVERVLWEWGTGLGARVLRGHELRGLTAAADHVGAEVLGPDGPLRVRAEYVVGCDGEQSAVRRLAGFDFAGADAERELLRADVAGVDIPGRRFQRLPRGLAIAARRPDGVTRVMVHEFGSPARPRTAEPDFGEIAAVWRRVTGEDIGHGTPLWANSFGDASRQVTEYRRDRVLLAGDAAHRQMPIGGQALNLALQDAVNLGWKLAATVTGRGGEDLLDSYHGERHPVGRRVLSNIKAQARLLLGGAEVEAVREVFGELVSLPPARSHLAAMIAGLDITYDGATGGGDGGGGDGGHPLLGRRFPPLSLTTPEGGATVAALLRTGRGVLLDLSGDTGRRTEWAAALRPWTGRVSLAPARPRRGEDLAGVTDTAAFLLRPDGYVAWAATSGTAELTAALHRWFGTPPGAPAATTTTSPGRPTAATGTPTKAPATSADDGNHRRTTMGTLTGKTALVTGSSRGIGRATALRLAGEGALVAVHYTSNQEAADDVVRTIEKEGGRAFAVQAELGVPGDVHELFLGVEQGLKERTGATDLNILVNNAGVMGGVSPEDTTPELFDRVIAVNAKAPFFIIQRALTIMPDGGRIINISTGLTKVANPQEIAYAMSKGAVEMLALHFAKHLGPRGITVNSVAPGITRNSNPVFDIPEVVEQMAQLSVFNRVGEPRDVGDIVALLASDDARWITGAFVDASGGTLVG